MPAVAEDFLVREIRQRGRFRWHLLRCRCSTRDRRHDADRAAWLESGLVAVEVTDVLVVHVYVDETAQSPLVIEEVALDLRVLGNQLAERLADCGGIDVYGVKARGKLP